MANAIAVVASIIALGIIVYHLDLLIFKYRGSQDEIHVIDTEDGWPVALYRFLPESTDNSRLPVIICHGFGSTHFCFDPGPMPGLAPYLSDHGYDVWTIDLRGSGLSGRMRKKHTGKRPSGWNFDDYVKYDLPAVINYVRSQTGRDRVNWIGHSMGGMVMYSYLQTQDIEPIRSVAAIAGPPIFTHYKWQRRFAPQILAAVKRQKYLFFMEFTALFGFLGYLLPTRAVGAPFNFYPWFAVNGVSNPSTSLLAQFIGWVINDTSDNPDRMTYFKDGFHKITTPFLSMVGAGDWVAPPPDVRYGIEKMSSVDKKYVFFSKKTGARHNYDHVSILTGEGVKAEVWPVLLDWLEKHSGP